MTDSINATAIHWLVAISILTLTITPYTAFSFAERVAGASLLMGTRIGGTRYIRMRPSALQRYDPRVVVLSVVFAVVFSYTALQRAISIRRCSEKRAWFRPGGAVILGFGIAAMHHTAMSAVTFQRGSMPYFTENTLQISTIGVVATAFIIAIVFFGVLLTAVMDRRANGQVRKVLEQLSEERDRFYAAAESSMDALYICSAVRSHSGEIEDFVFCYLNSNVERMVNVPRTQLLGRKMCEVLPVNLTHGLYERYKQVVLTGEPLIYEFAIHDRTIKCAWIRIQAVKVRDGIAITASDITARKLDEEQVLHLAQHDPLTGVLNRSLLRDRISHAIEHARSHRSIAGVFLIDLDGFKKINDTLGHSAGDGVLVTVANRLKSMVRDSDSVVRMGGDEFVIVIPDLKQSIDARRFAEKLIAAFQVPITIDGRCLAVTCSVGGVAYPDPAVDSGDLLAKADLALYTAKKLGKNRFHISGVPAALPYGAKLEEFLKDK